MHDDEWCNLVKRYQAAVSVFQESVDRLMAPGVSFQHSWENAEKARVEVTRTHAAILNHERLNHPRRYLAASAVAGGRRQTFPFHEPFEAEELVLGDQGQSGG